MEFKALFTRQISQADESIRVSIEGDDTFETFKAKVLEACLYGDARANLQMQRLVHDTSLTTQLNEAETQAVIEAAYKLFPTVTPPSETALTKGVKFEFSKLNGSGEALAIQITDVTNLNDLNSVLLEMWTLLDERVLVTNERELSHTAYTNTLPYQTKLTVATVLDILYGRAFKDDVEQRLKGSKETRPNSN